MERDAYLSASAWERPGDRHAYANEFKPKTVESRVGDLGLRVPKPQDRAEGVVPFYPSALKRGTRIEQAQGLTLAEMYVQGVSTRKVNEISEHLCRREVSLSQVSRLTTQLDEKLERWRTRKLCATPCIVLDATYVKVRHDDSVIDCAVLIAGGVRTVGKRYILGCSVSPSEAEVHWRAFLESLVYRGLHGIELVTSDDHAGLKAAPRAILPSAYWQRCQVHLQSNASAYVPKIKMRSRVAADIRDVFNAPDRSDVERLLKSAADCHRAAAPKLAEWTEAKLPEGLEAFFVHEKHGRRPRTSSMLGRLNRALKRRIRVASLFPNEASALHLTTAVLAENSADWETGRIYLSMESS